MKYKVGNIYKTINCYIQILENGKEMVKLLILTKFKLYEAVILKEALEHQSFKWKKIDVPTFTKGISTLAEALLLR